MPTSITAAPGFIQSPRTISVRPMAAIRISAWRTTAGRSRVREWHTVTVAFRPISSNAAGIPTIFERPSTTAFAPSILIPILFKQVDAAIGCTGHEERLSSFLGQATDVDRGETVHIFFDIDQRENPVPRQYVSGHGQLHQDAADLRIGIQLFTNASTCAWVASAGRCSLMEPIPVPGRLSPWRRHKQPNRAARQPARLPKLAAVFRRLCVWLLLWQLHRELSGLSFSHQSIELS